MATTPINNIVRSVSPKSIFESALPVLSSSVSFNQGDLIAFDTTNHILKVAATGDGANFLGVARNTIVNGLPKSPYQGTAVDASEYPSDIAGPVYGVVAFFTLKTSDTVTPGVKLYLTASAQTVTVTQPGSDAAIGIYQGKGVTSAPAGTLIDVLVTANYSGLNF